MRVKVKIIPESGPAEALEFEGSAALAIVETIQFAIASAKIDPKAEISHFTCPPEREEPASEVCDCADCNVQLLTDDSRQPGYFSRLLAAFFGR